MAEIRPFAALHYNQQNIGRDVSAVIAPPYDVLSRQQLDHYAGLSEHNIVHVDLPHFPPGSAGPDSAYAAADKKLRAWTDAQVLVQDQAPRFYAYQEDFTFAGRTYSRLCMLAVLRLSAFGSGQVYPHEQTFGGPIADRLKLMQATRCQISPIFGFVQAPLHEMLAKAPGQTAETWQGDLQGVGHKVTPIADEPTLRRISEVLAPLPVYIADGHHRYKTALAYRDWLAEQNGPLPDDHPANFVMIGLTAMDDPGNLLLPTHRIVEGLTAERLEDLRQASGEMLQWRELDPAALADPDKILAAERRGAFLFVAGEPAEAWIAVLTRDELPAQYAPDRSEAFRRLALSFLHLWLIDSVLNKDGRDPVKISYTHDAAEAKEAVNANTATIMVQPCTMDELMASCNASDTMPQKSTYFYPKLATGLVLHRLEA